MDQLSDKTLVMIVGPSAVGKSTLMNEVVSINPNFGRVSGFTTREPRPNDEPGLYRYISKELAGQKISNGELIQYAIFPTTGQIYGSEGEDYPAHYNLLDTLANVVDELRVLPFENTITISLTASPEQWKSWFLSRYPEPSNEAMKRLEEAMLSIAWSLSDTKTFWLKNGEGEQHIVAQKLIDMVISKPTQASVPNEPRAMLELIERGIWSSND